VGCVQDHCIPFLLDEGTFNLGTIKDAGTIHWVSGIHIDHGECNYVCIPHGKYAKVWAEEAQEEDSVKALVLRLLTEEGNFIESHLFEWFDAGDEHIHHGSIHRISVEKGCVAKIMNDNYPQLCGRSTESRLPVGPLLLECVFVCVSSHASKDPVGWLHIAWGGCLVLLVCTILQKAMK
jgi:hypothetical protein